MPIRGASGGGAVALDDLIDVILTAPTKNDVLQYNGASWVNQNFLLFGDDSALISPVANRGFDVRQKCKNNTSQAYLGYAASGFTGGATGIWRGFFVQLSGTIGYISGIFTAQALYMLLNPTVPAGVTVTEFLGSLYQVTPQETNSGVLGINTITGHKAQALGPSSPNLGHLGTLLRGMNSDISNRLKSYEDVIHFDATLNSSPTGTVTDWVLFGSSGNWVSLGASVTNFYVLRYNPAANNAVNKYGLWLSSILTKSVIGHNTTIAGITDPLHGLDSQSSLGLKTTANKVAAYNAAAETIIPCDATAAAFAVNLPTAVGIRGRIYIIKKVDATANAVTVTPNGAETIDGAATVVLNAQWQVTRIVSDNANWLII